MFWSAWNFQFSLVPVLATFLIFEIPSYVRRFARWNYTPIYFMFFPLGHSDQLYAQYFNEDDFYLVGQSQTPAQKHALRQRIIARSIISMAASTVVAPLLCGFIAAFYLTAGQFTEFVWFLLVVKTATLIISIRGVRDVSFVYRSNSFRWVILIYVVYLALIWWQITASYEWTAASIASAGMAGTFKNIGFAFYKEILFSIMFVSALTWAITYLMTDPKLIPACGEEEPI